MKCGTNGRTASKMSIANKKVDGTEPSRDPLQRAPVDERESFWHRRGGTVARYGVGNPLSRRADERLREKVGHVVLSRTVTEVEAAVADMFAKPVVDAHLSAVMLSPITMVASLTKSAKPKAS